MLLMPLGWLINEQIAISKFVATMVTSNRILPNGVEAADAGPRSAGSPGLGDAASGR